MGLTVSTHGLGSDTPDHRPLRAQGPDTGTSERREWWNPPKAVEPRGVPALSKWE